MSSDVPVQVLVAAFNDEAGADVALADLKQAKEDGLIEIRDAVVLRKSNDGKLHVKETADMGGRKGAAIGGVAGAALGLLAGPALVVPVAVGALVGGLGAKLRDSGFDNSRLKRVGDGLTPGSSALIAVVEHSWVERVQEQLAREGADVMAEALRADIADQLEAGHDVAYTALTTSEGLAVGRIATGEDFEEGGVVIATPEGAAGARWVATKEGFVAQSDADDVED